MSYPQAPFCLATDGHSIFGAGFAFNLSLNLTDSGASTYPDWLVLLQSTSTQLPPALESSPFFNISMYTQLSALNWTIIFSTPRVAVNLFPNISYAFSCGLALDGYFGIHAQPYPDLHVQLVPSLLIRIPTTNSTGESAVDNSANEILHDSGVLGTDNIEAKNTEILTLHNENSDSSSSPMNLGTWVGSKPRETFHWYSQPGSATALVAANDIIAANCTEKNCTRGESTDPREWVQIWSTCATDMKNLDQINIQFAVSKNGLFRTTPQTTWELQNPESLGPRVLGSRCPIYVWNSTLFVVVQFSDRLRVSILPVRRVLAQGNSGLETISISQPYQTTDPIKAVEFPPQPNCTNSDKGMISSFGNTIHVLCFRDTVPSLHLMFNSRTNISTTRVVDPQLYYYYDLDWPSSMRFYPSMCPLYANADGFALSVLVSRGHFIDVDIPFSGRRDLPSITISWNWTATFELYGARSQQSGSQNFSSYLSNNNAYNSYQYESSSDNPDLSASQIVLIVIFSALLPWFIYGAVCCCRAQKKKKSVGIEFFDFNIPIQPTKKSKNKSKRKKGKQESKKSARTKSKAWGIPSWKRSRKHEGGVGPGTGGSNPRPGLLGQEERTGDSDEDDLAKESEEPPGSKICEAEVTHAMAAATGYNLGLPAATAFGATAMHGGLEDTNPQLFRRLNAGRVADIRISGSSTALRDDQPLRPGHPPEIDNRFSSPSELIPLTRHRLWSVVTSLSNQSSLPQQSNQGQQRQSSESSVQTATMAGPSIPSTTDAYVTLAGITIEGTRPLPLLTGIGAAPLVSIPMSVFSSPEHSGQPNQRRWARTNSTSGPHLTLSVTRTTDLSSASPTTTSTFAPPSAPPLP